MKPASIRKFDLLYLGSIALSIVGFALGYGAMTEMVQTELAAAGAAAEVGAMSSGMLIGGILFGVAISVAIWFLISVLRIEIVKWLLIVLTVWGATYIPAMFADGIQATDATSLVGTAMTIAAIYFLFQPDAKAWFAEKRGAADPE